MMQDPRIGTDTNRKLSMLSGRGKGDVPIDSDDDCHVPLPAFMTMVRNLHIDEMDVNLIIGTCVTALAASVLYLHQRKVVKKKRRKRRFWVKPWMVESRRKGSIFQLYTSIIAADDQEEFRMTLRMTKDAYDELLELVRPFITKQRTNWRGPISAEQRLALTMRYLAFGDAFFDLHQQFAVGHSSVGYIIHETIRGICDALKDTYLPDPTEARWRENAAGFMQRWNLPHCLGAIDGKHFRIKAPPKSGSLFYNYKHFYSVVLLAIVDHNYEFVYVDIGAEGRCSDGGIWSQCKFYEDLSDPENPLEIPAPRSLPGYEGELPYYLVGDDAFKLTPFLMKPYPTSTLTRQQRVYNYRLCRGRRIVENAFGILATKFRLFLNQMEISPANADRAIFAAVCLHNFCRRKCGKNYITNAAVDTEGPEHEIQPGLWRMEGGVESIRQGSDRNPSVVAKRFRDALASYFLTPQGEVAWQYRAAHVDE